MAPGNTQIKSFDIMLMQNGPAWAGPFSGSGRSLWLRTPQAATCACSASLLALARRTSHIAPTKDTKPTA